MPITFSQSHSGPPLLTQLCPGSPTLGSAGPPPPHTRLPTCRRALHILISVLSHFSFPHSQLLPWMPPHLNWHLAVPWGHRFRTVISDKGCVLLHSPRTLGPRHEYWNPPASWQTSPGLARSPVAQAAACHPSSFSSLFPTNLEGTPSPSRKLQHSAHIPYAPLQVFWSARMAFMSPHLVTYFLSPFKWSLPLPILVTQTQRFIWEIRLPPQHPRFKPPTPSTAS